MEADELMVKNLDHIGVAVKNLDESLKFYTDILGLEVISKEIVKEQKVKVAFVPIGDSEIEFLESTDCDAAIAKYIEKRGEGIHHIALRVENIEKALELIREKGIRLIDEKVRCGLNKTKIAFLHPKSTNGVLIELVERNGKEDMG